MLGFFTAWLIVDLPFSIWLGGSIELLKETWSKSFLAFVITAALIVALGMREFSNILGPVFLALVLSIAVHPIHRLAARRIGVGACLRQCRHAESDRRLADYFAFGNVMNVSRNSLHFRRFFRRHHTI